MPYPLTIMRAMISARSFHRTLLAAICAVMAATAAQAQDTTERIDDFGQWSAYRTQEGGNPVCYMASEPTAAKGKYTKRGDIFALVSHRPAEDRRDEVSFMAGYPIKTGSAVEVKIGKNRFQLRVVDNEGAWTESPEQDKALVRAMIRGSTMTVVGTSARGTRTTDTYSLSGFTKAYQAITNGCGL